MLTGESVPVEVAPGADVFGATLNTSGRLVVTATRVGSDTALAQVARLVEAAQSAKAPVQRLADRISSVFVPIVLALAALTLAGWLVTGGSAARRVHGRGRGADHRVPVRVGTGDTDRDHGRHRTRCAVGHRDQGRRRARGDATHREHRRRQDRHDHRRPYGARRRGRRTGRRARRGAAPRGLGRRRVRASDRPGDRARCARTRARRCGHRTRSRTTPGSACVHRSTVTMSSSDARRSSMRLHPSCPPRSNRRVRHGRTAVVAGWDGTAARCSSSPTRSSRPRARRSTRSTTSASKS